MLVKTGSCSAVAGRVDLNIGDIVGRSAASIFYHDRKACEVGNIDPVDQRYQAVRDSDR